MKGLSTADYLDFSHPVQQEILEAFASLCGIQAEQVELGIDGCSAPNFAVPLYHAALGLARLSDSQNGGLEQPHRRRQACATIFRAMTAHPDMVGGPDSFDTALMQAAGGSILAKTGAEGFYGLALGPGLLGEGSPGAGIALKISDGDGKDRARPAVVLELLRQLGVLPGLQDRLAAYGPSVRQFNWRRLEIGQARPCFALEAS
jgi:L-asparaginase II